MKMIVLLLPQGLTNAPTDKITQILIQSSYRKIPIISPGLIFVQKDFLLDLFSGELIFVFSLGIITGGNFLFENGLSLTITTV